MADRNDMSNDKRFSGGHASHSQALQRAAESLRTVLSSPTGLILVLRQIPAINRWAIFMLPPTGRRAGAFLFLTHF
jgi:hypothetical protein